MPVKQAPTAYFAAERSGQATRRIKGHIQRLGLPEDLPCYFGDKPIDLLSESDVKFLISNIKAIESDAGAPLGFLVIDTQSRTMGGDENSTKDSAAYARAVEAIRHATEATLWIIAHTGHSEDAQDRPRGSSALLGAYDTFYRHKKIDEDHGSIKITIDRDGLGGKELPFAVELFDTGAVNEDGEPVVVPYLEAAPPPVKFTFKKGDQASKTENPTRAESEALRALQKAIKKHGVVTPKGEGIPAGEVTVCERQWRDVLL
jgi:AAA domain